MADPSARPEPKLTAEAGPWGGPVYRYRGAEIRCNKGGHVCGLLVEGRPLDGWTFGAGGTVITLVDLRVEGHRLPRYMHVVPKADG